MPNDYHSMKISVTIFLGFAIILLLFSITTFVNFRQSQEVQENTQWVAASQVVIRNSLRYQRNIIDMESSLRGFLFTGEASFLEPYDSAASENQQLFLELDSLIKDHSAQEKNLHDIQQLHQRWREEFAEPLITAKKKAQVSDIAQQTFNSLYKSKTINNTEKVISRQIRNTFKEFNNYEYELRALRSAKLEESINYTRRISFALTTVSILLGIIIALYISYAISRRIQNMVNLAERIANGNFNILIRDRVKDELGRLSRSLNRMTKILNENISELERKNKELDRFAYVVSHDLKAPLRGIENTSSWIEEDFGDQLPEKVKEYLGMIKGRIRRMENLIEGILALSRIGKVKKPLEMVDTGLMLQEIVEMLSPASGIRIQIQPGMPVLTTERIPLQQIFTNLISNAIKYHHRKDGTISITYKDLGKHYEFSVTDDGPGIEPQYHEKIFIIFQTLKERDAFESTGVGLAITKKILDDKKCDIKVISDVGKGATFSFTWPK